MIYKGDLDTKLLAYWINGKRLVSQINGNCMQSRIPSYLVTLINFPSDQMNVKDFLLAVNRYIQSDSSHKLFGLTQNTITNEYLMVLDEFFL